MIKKGAAWDVYFINIILRDGALYLYDITSFLKFSNYEKILRNHVCGSFMFKRQFICAGCAR